MALSASDFSIEGLPFGVYYTDGEDSYWQKKVENAFRSLLPEGSLSLYVFDKLSGIDEIFSAISTFGFFDEKPVVIVTDVEFVPNAKDHADLEKLAVNDSYVLFSGVKFLTDKEKKNFEAIRCAKLDKFACARLAAGMFPNGVDRDAINKLVELTDCDMARIHIEAKKLQDYADGQPIHLADVNEVVVEDAEAQIFSFVSDLTAGRRDRARKTLEKLRKRGDAPGYILSVLIGQYRRMLHAGLSKKNDAELASIMKVKEYAVKKARSEKAGGNRQIKSIVAMLVSYEYKFKQGMMSEQAALDAAVDRLMGGEV